MWTTIVLQLRINARRRTVLFWALAFPILLATLFFFMFGSLAHAYDLHPQPVAVVGNKAWQDLGSGNTLIDQHERGSAETDTDTQTNTQTNTGVQGGALITAQDVDDRAQAEQLLKQGDVVAYLYADEQGRIAMVISDTASETNDTSEQVSISALHLVVTQFNETGSLTTTIGEQNPAAFADPKFSSSIGSAGTFSKEVSLTHFSPDATARFYFALLGMACLQAMTIAIVSVTEAQANLSALGARRTIAPLPKHQLIAATFLSSWCASFVCMLISFLVIRYVFDVHVGGREGAALLGIGVSTFMATALGTMIGATPRMPLAVKTGISTALSTTLALFAGLYGRPSMELGDAIERSVPMLADLNPVRQVATLFYDILFYESFGPFFRTIALLLAMSGVFLLLAIILLRRQRYEHL